MELDEREGSVEHHKRLRTLWVAWEPDVRMCVGNRGRKAPSLSWPGGKGFGPSCSAELRLLFWPSSSECSTQSGWWTGVHDLG